MLAISLKNITKFHHGAYCGTVHHGMLHYSTFKYFNLPNPFIGFCTDTSVCDSSENENPRCVPQDNEYGAGSLSQKPA